MGFGVWGAKEERFTFPALGGAFLFFACMLLVEGRGGDEGPAAPIGPPALDQSSFDFLPSDRLQRACTFLTPVNTKGALVFQVVCVFWSIDLSQRTLTRMLRLIPASSMPRRLRMNM